MVNKTITFIQIFSKAGVQFRYRLGKVYGNSISATHIKDLLDGRWSVWMQLKKKVYYMLCKIDKIEIKKKNL